MAKPNNRNKEQFTPEELAKHYSALLDSVALINDFVTNVSAPTQDDKDTVTRNVEHLEIMMNRIKYWGDNDVSSIPTAISSGKSYTA